MLIFQLPSVQKEIANKFTKWIEEEYELKIQVDKIKPSILGGLHCNDFLILDGKNDTLIYVEKFKIQTSNYSFNHFNKVYIQDLVLNCDYIDSISNSNIFKAFEPFLISKSNSKPLEIDNLWVNNASIDITNTNKVNSFREVNLYLKECLLSSEIDFVMSNLDFEVVNGAHHELDADRILLSQNMNVVNEFNWKSGNSSLQFDLMQNLLSNQGQLKINDFILDHYALQGLFEWPEDLILTTNALIKTSEDTLWAKNLMISTDNESLFNGTFQIKNWTDFKSWNYSVLADTLNIASKEWAWIKPLYPNMFQLSLLGDVNSEARFEGTLSDLNLNLSLQSDKGSLDSDIYINIDSLDDFMYRGNLNLNHFNLDLFKNRYGFEEVDGEINVEGKGIDILSFDTEIVGNLNSLNIRGRTYENIVLNGRLHPSYFKGELWVSDEDLEFDFSGEVDFSKDKPIMDFVANVVEADLVKLNLYNNEPVAKLSSLIEINLKGNDWSNIEGELGVYHSSLETSNNHHYYNDILFTSEKFKEKDILSFKSDFLTVNLEGQIDVPNIFNSLLAYLNPHFPLISGSSIYTQDFEFEVDFLNTSALTEFLIPKFNLEQGTRFYGSYRNRREGLKLTLECPGFSWGKYSLSNLNLSALIREKDWVINLLSDKCDYDDSLIIENISLNQLGSYGKSNYIFNWESSDSIKFQGGINGFVNMDRSSLKVLSDESKFYFADTLWTLKDSSYFNYFNGEINSQVSISTASQGVSFSCISNDIIDTINLTLNHFEMANISPWLSTVNSSLNGRVNGDFSIIADSFNNKVYSDIITSNLVLNNSDFGALNLSFDYDDIQDVQVVQGYSLKDYKKALEFSGKYNSLVDSNNIHFFIDVNDFNLNHLNTYLPFVDPLKGLFSGYLNFYGNINEPKFEGEFVAEEVYLSVPYLNVDFKTIGESNVQLSHDLIELNNFSFQSIDKGRAFGDVSLNGKFKHHYFSDINMDFNLNLDSILCLNTDAFGDNSYFGKVISTGDVVFNGQPDLISIDFNGISDKGTMLYIPLDDSETIDEFSFVHFLEQELNNNNSDSLMVLSEMINSDSNLAIDMNFELNENAEVNIIFDETLGDKIRARGSGFINLGFNSADDIYMYGDYRVNEGDYLFTLQNFVNKKFEIENGALISWDGNPYKAKMDLSALYRLTSNVSNLTSNLEVNRNSEVECRMLMSGDLLKPDIVFDIKIPNADDQTNRILEEQTNTEEKNTQQFLSLLVLNSFMSSSEYENTDVDYLSSTVSSGAEMLNNQLFNWTSQFSNRFDLGLKYNPNLGDSLSNREFEILLNNMKLNDRITFNGNIATQQSSSNIVGDFKFEYKLSDDGKFRLVAFRKLEESFQLAPDVTNYTGGVGLFYTDEFQNFKELWTKFKYMFQKKNDITSNVY
tara:strand:- start:1496 stop:5731 length:4236 start_codon:yes stop_codon:yes gene_type:complete